MKTKKVPFFIRLKNAITNFDEYKNYLEEKISIAIKYILKLVLLFTLIISIALTYKIANETNKLIIDFQNQCPEFSFQNNILTIEGDNKKIIKGDETGYFGVIIDAEKSDSKDVEEISDYQRAIVILKDKIVIKDVENTEMSTTYEQLSHNYNLNNINKETALEFLSRK